MARGETAAISEICQRMMRPSRRTARRTGPQRTEELVVEEEQRRSNPARNHAVGCAEDKALSALGQSTTPTGPSEAIPTADSRAIAAEGFSYALRRCLFRARTRTHGARATMRSPRDYLTRVRLRRNGTGRATPTRVRPHRPSAPLSSLGRPNRPCPTQRQTTPIASMPRPDR